MIHVYIQILFDDDYYVDDWSPLCLFYFRTIPNNTIFLTQISQTPSINGYDLYSHALETVL